MFHLTQAVHRNAQIRKNSLATIHGDRQRTWAEFKERVARFAGGLHSLGIEAGDRVAILSLNSDRYFEYYSAVPWAGACVVPLNVRWTPKENDVSNHPAVAQVIVIGIPHDEWGEQVHAEVILKEGRTATEAEIIAKTKEYIASYKCPRSVKFRTEPFPMSAAGKLLKRDVRKIYWEGKDRLIN